MQNLLEYNIPSYDSVKALKIHFANSSLQTHPNIISSPVLGSATHDTKDTKDDSAWHEWYI